MAARRARWFGLGVVVALLVGACGDHDRDAGTASAADPGWTVTVYYTAVEEHHDGAPTPVTGCPELDCAGGDDDLGTYPADFVQAVEDEGTGRITRGPHAGRYLNWSHDVGFWLDVAPRASDGEPLEPWRTAAADPGVLAAGTSIRVSDCGDLEEGGAPSPAVCDRLRVPEWVVADEFTPGLGGEHHVDLYVGEETGPDFTTGDLYTTLVGARLDVG
jgi:hypothetical protein